MHLAKHPYIIIETANTHGGNFDYLTDLVESFSGYTFNFGIKFQPFHYDGIALPDFKAYDIYRSLFFEKIRWQKIILLASRTKDVWLDLFDLYGVQIFRENFNHIAGIKLQSSVLHNNEVFNELINVGLKGKKIILNIAAQTIDSVKEVADRADHLLYPEEILLEFGYQSYPTEFEDSGLCKIAELKKNYNYRLVFADHVDGQSDDAIWLPIVAISSGAHVIEKHVFNPSYETKYDQYSSLSPARFAEMVKQLERYTSLHHMPFINEKESAYLEKTQMLPVLKKEKRPGSLIHFGDDFIYRRTGKKGLDIKQIRSEQAEQKVLNQVKTAGETIITGDFRKARIGSIIACRMKSTRLPQKALALIGGLPSVELCLKNTLKIKNLDSVTLATSFLEEDQILKDHCYNKRVNFYAGEPLDVIKRFIGVVEELKLDVIIRQTADNVFISDDIAQVLIQSHFETGADYTCAKEAAIGTNFEIITVNALKRVKEYFPAADYSEYMTWYFRNNPEYFSINMVDLPGELIRDYRLTLDYPEDLKMYNKIFEYLPTGIDAGIKEIFDFLDHHPEIISINKNMDVVYESNHKLIETLNRVTRIR